MSVTALPTEGAVRVRAGRFVWLREGEEHQEFTVVSADGADMTIGRISAASPVGRAAGMVSRPVGQVAVLPTPEGSRLRVQVVGIIVRLFSVEGDE